MSIATNLKREMISHDMNAARLSELSGVSKSNILKYLEGKYKPADEVLDRLANGIGCNVSDLRKDNTKLFKKKENVTVAAAAQMLGVNAQTLRLCLQRGIYDFGVATFKTGRYTYDINAAKLLAYVEANKKAVGPLLEYYRECVATK